MLIQLTPCPFCGSKDIGVNPLLPPFRAYCKDCGAEGPDSTISPEMALLYWNTAGCPGKLTWTKSRPTEPGFYFYKRDSKVFIIRICFTESGLINPVPSWEGQLWAGPIPEPEEV